MKHPSACLLLFLLAIPLAPAQSADRPNIVLFMIDDLGWRDPGYTGNKVIQTPHIDRLAGNGIIFSQAYAAAPNCAPTRACLMTGQYPPRHGIYTVVDERHAPGSPQHKIMAAPSRAELATASFTLAEALRSHGYATGMSGMWNLGRGRRGPGTPTGQGFDSYVQPKDLGFERDAYQNEKGEYLTDRLTDAGIAFIKERRDKPFFLYLAYHAVHSPFDPKPDLLKKYQAKCDDPAYAATVEALDQNVGRVVKALESSGLAKNTYILFTSDNGGTRRYVAPLRGGKGTLYEGGLRVPAFACGPGIPAGRKSAEPVSTIDLYPTLLELAGLPVPEAQTVDGLSLVPLLRGQPAPDVAGRDLFWHYPHYGNQGGEPSAMVRSGDWKLIHYYEDGRDELYDLAADPGELRDLAAERPAAAADLRDRLDAWLAKVDARPPRPDPQYDAEQERARLEHLATDHMAQLEAQHAQYLDPAWEPNADWWGSQVVED